MTSVADGSAPSVIPLRPVEPRWETRPTLATAVRVAIFAIPFCASMVAAWLMTRALDVPEGLGEHLLWWAGVLAASLGALLVFDRAVRGLLPLAALLRLSLIFPDRAPSRLGVALRSGSTRRLQAREVEALQRGELEPAQAAHTILALASNLNVHDRGTRGHSERVRAYADLIGAELGLDAADRDRLRWAALLHDLGKLSVPATTLNNHHQLSPDDWETLRRHPLEGARLAQSLGEWLGPWSLAIEQHHERYDGTGYPYGLAGSEISLGARIVAVADSYDAMTSPRAY
ncbi:MAG: HD-GYP domain-containing protein, partial [Acidimicrobiales bacterium]